MQILELTSSRIHTKHLRAYSHFTRHTLNIIIQRSHHTRSRSIRPSINIHPIRDRVDRAHKIVSLFRGKSHLICRLTQRINHTVDMRLHILIVATLTSHSRRSLDTLLRHVNKSRVELLPRFRGLIEGTGLPIPCSTILVDSVFQVVHGLVVVSHALSRVSETATEHLQTLVKVFNRRASTLDKFSHFLSLTRKPLHGGCTLVE